MPFLAMRTLLFSLVCGVVVSACSTTEDVNRDLGDLGIETEQEYRNERARLIAALEEAIGEARAKDEAACAVVNIGTKACGGPVEYRVYSTTDGDPGRVRELAEDVTALDAAANAAFGLASTCDVPIPPTPALVSGTCVAS